jgi:cellulose synthase/poly-beta-1,6-N-acetylglucosamine synthase-like glycosyltransferase
MLTELLILGSYGLILILLAVFGFHRSMLVWLYFKHKKNVPRPKGRFEDLPRVTIQLPVYNEMYVSERLLEAAARIDYPRDKLDIQVLDDSTDETTEICRRKVDELRATGLDIVCIHRENRAGFKAGALENGLETAKGEFVMIFDADFIPQASVVKECIHYFTDPKIAVVQARWGHLNYDHSAITRVQALMLDGHFIMEHTARCRSGRFFNFNGTAGIWRRSAIDDAGGWEHDTLTEDMDLSYRAQLKGWRFVYLKDLIVPAELPVEMNAFKAQQFRWAKGSIQNARKILPRVLRSDVSGTQKVETFFHLTNNVAYPLILLLSVLLLPCLMLRSTHGWREVVLVDLPLFFGTTLSVCTFYMTTQREEGSRSIWWGLKRLPLLLATGIGLSVNQTRAVFEALLGRVSGFVRTPKHGVVGKVQSWKSKRYRGSLTVVPFIEVAMALYFAVTLGLAIWAGRYVSIPFVILFGSGYAYVGFWSLAHGIRRQRKAAADVTAAAEAAAADVTAVAVVAVAEPLALPAAPRPAELLVEARALAQHSFTTTSLTSQ